VGSLLGVGLEIPDHTTFSRRSLGLSLVTEGKQATEPVDVVIDSTELKVYGAGEWQREKCGERTRRTWRKLHLAVNPNTSEILASELTTKNVGDLSMVASLLKQIPGPSPRSRRMARTTVNPSTARLPNGSRSRLRPWSPPRATAVPHAITGTPPSLRDQHIHLIQEKGRRSWQKAVG
jgi:hypothetical protein